jgi:hypothetical protein
MQKILFLSLFLSGLVSPLAFSQPTGKLNLGIGAGIDYGGFGGQLSYLPAERVALFGALGYNLAGAGYNFGAKMNFPNEKKVEWHITAMYGYNAVLVVEGDLNSKTTYYGPSAGAGMVIKSRIPGKSFWSFELLIPFRPGSFHDAVDDLKLLGFDVREPLPVGISFGYHINIL